MTIKSLSPAACECHWEEGTLASAACFRCWRRCCSSAFPAAAAAAAGREAFRRGLERTPGRAGTQPVELLGQRLARPPLA